MPKHTPEQVKEEIKKLPTFTEEQLVHYTKIISSKQTTAEKKLYEPLMKALLKERKSRGLVSTISSTIVKPTLPKKSATTANPDDY